MLAAEPPPVAVAASLEKPADVVVVRRETRSEVLANKDTALPLIKAGRSEDALLRQAIFVTINLSVVRPASGEGADTLRWTYQSYLQRQLCFTSITGLFSCAAAEVEELAEKSAGETPIAATPDQPAPAPNPDAEAARSAVVATLRARSDALFAADRRLKLDPMLKAAGVSIRRPQAAARPVRR